MDNDFLKAENFFKHLSSDSRIFLLIRHGERRHITADDKDFGAYVGLTEKGRQDAFSLGKLISEREISFFSSPVHRCVETAQFIGKGAGIEKPAIEELDSLGNYFVCNYDLYVETLQKGFYEGICKWLEGGETKAFYPIKQRSNEMVRLFMEKGKSFINVFVSHDAWIVPMLTYFSGLKFSPSQWMNFLTGIVFVQKEDSTKAFPITALDSGYLLF